VVLHIIQYISGAAEKTFNHSSRSIKLIQRHKRRPGKNILHILFRSREERDTSIDEQMMDPMGDAGFWLTGW
jgi:hypothetical protein